MQNKFTIQKNFAINAGAGSGKTYTLSRRYINAILGFDFFRENYERQQSYFKDKEAKKAAINEILTITYTEAAASEMKSRIFELINKIINHDTLDTNDKDYTSIRQAFENEKNAKKYVVETLKKAYVKINEAKISTIHSFCLDTLKSNSDIAKIDSKLEVIQDDEKNEEILKIVSEVFNSNQDKILDITSDISMYYLNLLINSYIDSSNFRGYFDSFTKESFMQDEYKELIEELYPLESAKTASEELKANIQASNLQNKQAYMDFLDEYITNIENFKPISWTILAKEKDVSITQRNEVFKQNKENLETIKSLEKLIPFYAQIDESQEALFFEKIQSLKNILHKIIQKYEARLNELGKISFDAIISKMAQIEPNLNLKYIMIDEFQDTNALQFKIIKNIKQKHTNLFVVGDSKQSIYSFQGAQIEVFNDAIEDKAFFEDLLNMSTNHRSDGVILENVNKIFQKLLVKNSNLKTISQNYEASSQDLSVYDKSREKKGSFKFLITANEYKQNKEELVSQIDTIANFIYDITCDKYKEYSHIKTLIKSKNKAIAVVFDSKKDIEELKAKLKLLGISSATNAPKEFFQNEEINDIFNVLKAVWILAEKQKNFNGFEKYYLVGAMRSNLLRTDDNSIKNYIDKKEIPPKLKEYCQVFKEKSLSEFVKFIIDDSNLFGVYAHFPNFKQKEANVYKLLNHCIAYEKQTELNLEAFLNLFEKSIFEDVQADEGYSLDEASSSIQLCSIHATKGLAYPMIILAKCEKALFSQVTSESIKYNDFTQNNTKKELIGFKINNYTPLSHRALKQIDKLKHLAEKKRLLYVALTRAQNHIVLSGELNKSKQGNISFREDSYLSMIHKSLDIELEELFSQKKNHCIEIKKHQREEKSQSAKVKYIENPLKPLEFTEHVKQSATQDSETKNTDALHVGTLTHKIIQFHHHNFSDEKEAIFNKFQIHDKAQKEQICQHLDNFYKSDIYEILKSDIWYKFELEFNHKNKTGFIDLLYYDKAKQGYVVVDFKTGKQTEESLEIYKKQLDFYKKVLEENDLSVIETRIVWL